MSQVNLFNFTFPEYKVKKPIRLIELFSGVGSQAMALKNIGADFEHYRAIDFDKFAMASYNAVHNTKFSVGDITKTTGDDLGIVDTDKFEYIMTYSFPCQDLSTAGHGKGMSRDSGTRSGLLWEVERLLNETKELPQILLMENVPQVIGKKHINDFQSWLDFLKNKGYSNYYKQLNSKDFGVAQNRRRVFMVSVLGDYLYEFPKETKLTKTIKDYLLDEVDEKFYLTEEKSQELLKTISPVLRTTIVDSQEKGKKRYKVKGARTTLGVQVHRNKPMIIDDTYKNRPARKYSHTSPTLRTGGGGFKVAEPMIIDDTYKSRNSREYSKAAPTLRAERFGFKVAEPVIIASRGRNPDNPNDRTPGGKREQRLEINTKGLSNTLTTVQKDNWVLEPKIEFGRMGRQAAETFNENQPKKYNTINPFNKTVDTTGVCPTITTRPEGFKTAVLPVVGKKPAADSVNSTKAVVYDPYNRTFPANQEVITTLRTNYNNGNAYIATDYRIRKLTPQECWRLMGFSDEAFFKAEAVCSNSQLYKQAGNSIVVNVLEAIFKQLL